MATGTIKVNTCETLTLTRKDNSYVNATNFNRLAAFKKSGILFLKINLALSTATPAMSDFVDIGDISGWNSVSTILVGMISQGTTLYELSMQIVPGGTISIFTPSQTPAGPFFRQMVSIPANE